MKKFAIGFAVGFGLMYWYLDNEARLFSDADKWMQKSASSYRHDRMHEAADSVIENKK